MKELLPHQQRVVTESEELEIKLIMLTSFIQENEMFQKLDKDERMRMIRQHRAMSDYWGVLQERILAF